MLGFSILRNTAILQRLEHLRQEQLKALKELKKVEKAKRKRRRRTVHGCPVTVKPNGEQKNQPTSAKTCEHQPGDGSKGTVCELHKVIPENRESAMAEDDTFRCVKLSVIPEAENDQQDVTRQKLNTTGPNLITHDSLKTRARSTRRHRGSSLSSSDVIVSVTKTKIENGLNADRASKLSGDKMSSPGCILDKSGGCGRNAASKVINMESSTNNNSSSSPGGGIEATCTLKTGYITKNRATVSCRDEILSPRNLSMAAINSAKKATSKAMKSSAGSNGGSSPAGCIEIESKIGNTMTDFVTNTGRDEISSPRNFRSTSIHTEKKGTPQVMKSAAESNSQSLTPCGAQMKNKTENSRLDCATSSRQGKIFSSENSSSTTENVGKNTTLDKMNSLVSTELIGPDTDNGNASVTYSNTKTTFGTNIPNRKQSRLKKNKRIESPFTKIDEADVCFRFPKPDDNLLKMTAHQSDFVLPDKVFAALKLDKIKRSREKSLKDSSKLKLGLSDPNPDGNNNLTEENGVVRQLNSARGSVTVSSAADTFGDKDMHNCAGTSENECASKSEGEKQNDESVHDIPGENLFPVDPLSEDFSQNIFSQSILDGLTVVHEYQLSQQTCDDSTFQQKREIGLPHHQQTSHIPSPCAHNASTFSSGVSKNYQDNAYNTESHSSKECGEVCSEKVKESVLSQERKEQLTDSLLDLSVHLPPNFEDSFPLEDVTNERTQENALNEKCTIEDCVSVTTQRSLSKCSPENNIKGIDSPSEKIHTVLEIKKPILKRHTVGDQSCGELATVEEPSVTSQATPPRAQIVSSKEFITSGSNLDSEVTEVCLQHVDASWSSNEVRALRFLSLDIAGTKLQVIAVCLPKLLVLWKLVTQSSWVVLHKWRLDEEEEFLDVEITSADCCIVILTGGNFAKTLGRVYCVFDRGDLNFDLCEEVSFSDFDDRIYEFKNICLLPTQKFPENVTLVLASMCQETILLTKWTIDLLCFCSGDSTDFPEIFGCDMSSLILVNGSNCLLLGCVDSDVHLWNCNSCDLLCRMSLQDSLLCRPVCLSAETVMGMLFLVLISKEKKQIKLVAINPQNCREACLKTLDMGPVIKDPSDRLLYSCKSGPHVISSFTGGQLLLWDFATDKTNLLNLFPDDVRCISLHPEDSSIAFGTSAGSVHLNSYYNLKS